MSPNARPESLPLRLVYYAYLIASSVARALPERAAYRLAELSGAIKMRLTPNQARQVARNLSHVTGQAPDSPRVRSLVAAAYRSYARYWLETFRIVQEDRAFFLERFRCHREHNLDAVLGRGRGAVVVVGHLGNYDAAGAWAASTGRRLVTVVEVLKPRKLYEFFVRHREKLGMTIFPAQPGVTDKLVAAVDDGAVVAILGDRDLRGRGVEVEFFGQPTTLPAGAASVALRSRVPVLVAGVYSVRFDDGKRGWEAEMSAPIELPSGDGAEAVVELTRAIAKQLEEFIARRPEEWHVFHPFSVADRALR